MILMSGDQYDTDARIKLVPFTAIPNIKYPSSDKKVQSAHKHSSEKFE